jgi:hypothetical protein
LLSAAAFAYANLTGGVGAPKLHRKHRAVSISGHIDNLPPGVPTVLKVKARNNLRHRVELRTVRAQVGDASAECPRTLLDMEPIHGRRGLPPRRTRKVAIVVTLTATTPDKCQNAMFPVRYTGRAAFRRTAR